jgi:hypothetical protein
MISQLASPSVCVIDEDPDDYRPLLAALNGLYVSAVHISGDDIGKLPPEPFRGLRLAFVDLHLAAGAVGKAAASHTANVFRRVVSADAGPVVAVIWSKYAAVKVEQDGVPVDDQPTEADVFKETLLDAEPKYRGRVIFVEMEKLKPSDRPENEAEWVETLKTKIEEALAGQEAVDLLWRWDSLVREACVGTGAGLTALAETSAEKSGNPLNGCMKDILQRLAKAQGENNFSTETAPRHLAVALNQLLIDHLEQIEKPNTFGAHGDWLGVNPAGAGFEGLAAHMNGLLLASGVAPTATPFGPGTIYRVKDPDAFAIAFGKDLTSLKDLCCSKPGRLEEWRGGVIPVVAEISPECDVAQNYRSSALLLGGLLVPSALTTALKGRTESLFALPQFHLRQELEGFAASDVTLVLAHRYKATWPLTASPDWLEVWFRLRELPTAALRNAHAGQSSRVGYVSLSDKG